MEKNCINWAKEYFEKELIKIKTNEQDWTIEIKDGSTIEGDCDLNQRKGKILTIFDLKLSIPFEGFIKNLRFSF